MVSFDIIAFTTHTAIYATVSTLPPTPTFIHSSSSSSLLQSPPTNFNFSPLSISFSIHTSPILTISTSIHSTNPNNPQMTPVQSLHTIKIMLFYALLCSFFLLFLAGVQFSYGDELGAVAISENGTAAVAEMVPWIEAGKGKMMMGLVLNDSRRKLGSFRICSLCTCCAAGSGGGKGYCLPSPCCYAINCNIPNRPFGFCSFTPKTCNCLGCHL